MVQIIKNLVSSSIASKVSYKEKNKKKYIVIHETGNTGKGANADSHGRLQANGNSRQASWHYTVDDKKAVQSFHHDVSCWAAGSRQGNTEGIQIEICVNSDGDFKKAVRNAAELVQVIMKQENIPLSNVKQHYDFSKKNCPQNLRSGAKGINFSGFMALVNESTATGLITTNDVEQVIIKVDKLNFYSSPRWTNASGTVRKNEVFTVDSKVKVDGGEQYKLKSGNYITASDDYVGVFKKKVVSKAAEVVKAKEKGKTLKVQVGAFKDKENAEKLAKELKSKGYTVYITE